MGLLSLGLVLGTLSLGSAPSLAVSGGWFVSGEDTCFELTNSTYLNVTLCSTEVVNVTLESVPRVVSFTIRAVGNATSTEIAMSGFVPDATYYRHEDGHLKENFTADEAGNYTYNQDLSAPHHVFINEESSTKYFRDNVTGGDCTLIGTWDSGTKTCLLTVNILETIVMDANGITLDGGGHSITRGTGDFGVYAASRSGIGVKNLVVGGFGYGIYLYNSGSSTVSGNTVSATTGAYQGMVLSSSASSTVTGNTVSMSGSGSAGISVYSSASSTVSGNTVVSATYGIILEVTPSSTVSGNTVSAGVGIQVGGSGSTVTGNTVSVSGFSHLGIRLGGRDMSLSNNAMVGGGIDIRPDAAPGWDTHTIDTSNTVNGKPVQYCKNTSGGTIPIGAGQVIMGSCSNMIVENQDIRDVNDAILVGFGSGNTIRGNTVSAYNGIHLWQSGTSTVSGNTVSAGSLGILLGYPGHHTVSGNTVSSDGSHAIAMQGAEGSTVTGNTVSMSGRGSAGTGIEVGGSGSTVTGNTVSGSGLCCGRGISAILGNSGTVSGNTVSGSYAGIILGNSASITVTGNTVSMSGSGRYGITLGGIGTSTIDCNTIRGYSYAFELQYSNSNTIFHNNLIYNTYGVRSAGSTNTWNNAAREGNFWSDYHGLDDGSGGRTAGDGVGDTNIPHLGVDFYPLMTPVCGANEPPIVSITSPPAGSVYPVGAQVTFTGAFTDESDEGVHTATWRFDGITIPGTVTESGGSGSVTDEYAFLSPGVYPINLTVTDSSGAKGSADTVDDLAAFVVIYDPTAGFVTGGGWFESPPGAFAWDLTATGKATFGFVSKYQKGKSLPTGETEFQFKAGDLTFRSASYDWLVCSGPKCMFKGTGTVNGAGVYGFQLTAWDGDMPGGGGQDKIRMKVWNVLTGELVYDNQLGDDDFADPTTVIGGGSIVIHKG